MGSPCKGLRKLEQIGIEEERFVEGLKQKAKEFESLGKKWSTTSNFLDKSSTTLIDLLINPIVAGTDFVGGQQMYYAYGDIVLDLLPPVRELSSNIDGVAKRYGEQLILWEGMISDYKANLVLLRQMDQALKSAAEYNDAMNNRNTEREKALATLGSSKPQQASKVSNPQSTSAKKRALRNLIDSKLSENRKNATGSLDAGEPGQAKASDTKSDNAAREAERQRQIGIGIMLHQREAAARGVAQQQADSMRANAELAARIETARQASERTRAINDEMARSAADRARQAAQAEENRAADARLEQSRRATEQERVRNDAIQQEQLRRAQEMQRLPPNSGSTGGGVGPTIGTRP